MRGVMATAGVNGILSAADSSKLLTPVILFKSSHNTVLVVNCLDSLEGPWVILKLSSF